VINLFALLNLLSLLYLIAILPTCVFSWMDHRAYSSTSRSLVHSCDPRCAKQTSIFARLFGTRVLRTNDYSATIPLKFGKFRATLRCHEYSISVITSLAQRVIHFGAVSNNSTTFCINETLARRSSSIYGSFQRSAPTEIGSSRFSRLNLSLPFLPFLFDKNKAYRIHPRAAQ